MTAPAKARQRAASAKSANQCLHCETQQETRQLCGAHYTRIYRWLADNKFVDSEGKPDWSVAEKAGIAGKAHQGKRPRAADALNKKLDELKKALKKAS